MIQILTLNPLIGVIIALFAQLGVVIMLLLDASHWNPISNTRKWWIHQIVIAFFTSLYLIIIFLLLDIGFTWILGSWSLTDWRWQIPNVALLLLTGFLYFYFAIWNTKTQNTNLILFIFDTTVLGYIIHFSANQYEVMSIPLSQGLKVALPALLFIGTIFITVINYKNVSHIKHPEKSTNKMKHMILAAIILWLLLFIQTIILYDGSSFLYFL